MAKTAQQRRIEQLIRTQTAAIRKAFVEAMAKASSGIDTAALVRLLEAGNIEAAAQLFKIDSGVMYPLQRAIQDAFIYGGLAVTQDLPKGLAGRFSFDGAHPRAVALATEQAAALVTNISDDAIINARKVISDGLASNRALTGVARDLAGRRVGNRRVGGVLGLTQPQTDRAINIRSMLRDPARIAEYFEGGAARYKESDRRFDKLVRKAINDGRALSQADVDRVTDGYKAKATGNRAKTVARNEAFIAQATGRDESYRQMLEGGNVESVTVRWQHNLSVNPRDDHVAMDGTVIQLGETFNFPDGARMKYPHDPAGGAAHSIGCRCVAIHRVKLPRDEAPQITEGIIPSGNEPSWVQSIEQFRVTEAGMSGANDLARVVSKDELVSSLTGNLLGSSSQATVSVKANSLFLYAKGGKISEISRRIDLVEKVAEHSIFQLESSAQASGAGKAVLKGSVDLYKKIGIKEVRLNANISVGGYAWAKYGFAPDADSIGEVIDQFRRSANQNLSIPEKDLPALMKILEPRNRDSFWALSDSKWGKEVMLGSNWNGKLDITDEASMKRFNDYVGK